MLDIFALIILLVIIVAIVAGAIFLGMLPGRIARNRNHPQAEAINMCGWWGILTMGILLPLAYVWAYTKPQGNQEPADKQSVPSDDKKVEEDK